MGLNEDFSEIGSVKALLSDARERIKESEDRSTRRIDEVDKRIQKTLSDLEEQVQKFNNKITEWLPLLSNMTKAEETKRNATLLLVVALISNIAAWILCGFIWYIKSGMVTK
jgi:ElaB/YqjD/DUF883 family membrane-anchored ribosome-binding protein